MIIALDNVRSIFNVGAIFRTADSVGADKIILAGYTPSPPNDKLIKTSLGALDFITWEKQSNEEFLNFLREWKEKGNQIIAVEQSENSIWYTNNDLSWENTIYVFGNEIVGVNKEILDLSSKIIQLPMYGQKNSLNVSVTVGIISYEARKYKK